MRGDGDQDVEVGWRWRKVHGFGNHREHIEGIRGQRGTKEIQQVYDLNTWVDTEANVGKVVRRSLLLQKHRH